jgi:hypothetical protein
MDLTLRSWMCTQESKRRTLQRVDVTKAVAKNDAFDFLVDVISGREIKIWRRWDPSTNRAVMPSRNVSPVDIDSVPLNRAGLLRNCPNHACDCRVVHRSLLSSSDYPDRSKEEPHIDRASMSTNISS